MVPAALDVVNSRRDGNEAVRQEEWVPGEKQKSLLHNHAGFFGVMK